MSLLLQRVSIFCRWLFAFSLSSFGLKANSEQPMALSKVDVTTAAKGLGLLPLAFSF